jgi:hypothetical protein
MSNVESIIFAFIISLFNSYQCIRFTLLNYIFHLSVTLSEHLNLYQDVITSSLSQWI